jgi:biopolymer transport protein ExbB
MSAALARCRWLRRMGAWQAPGAALLVLAEGFRAAALAEETPAAPASALASLPRDLSPWSMFMNADMVVKTVMLGLAFASLTTWTIWLAKGFELAIAKRRARSATELLKRAGSLQEARAAIEGPAMRRGAVADFVAAATLETRRSDGLSAN